MGPQLLAESSPGSAACGAAAVISDLIGAAIVLTLGTQTIKIPLYSAPSPVARTAKHHESQQWIETATSQVATVQYS